LSRARWSLSTAAARQPAPLLTGAGAFFEAAAVLAWLAMTTLLDPARATDPGPAEAAAPRNAAEAARTARSAPPAVSPRPRRSLRLLPPVLPAQAAAELPFLGLDTLWLQLTGTLCNIACRHCFITCGPKEDRVPMMTRQRLEELLLEARTLGVKEFYFTGGEPMLHPEFFAIIERTLQEGPVNVLTNGTLIDAAAAARLAALSRATRYSLELRVSLDGMTAEQNDPVRGRGTFRAIIAGLRELAQVELSPVITVVEHQPGLADAASRQEFIAFARQLGLGRPRVKFLPLLRIGREPRRSHPYAADAHIEGPLEESLRATLQCSSGRLATQDHVLTCPLLLDAPEARLGTSLTAAAQPIRLRWSACHTCVTEGLSCRT
jgi:molybdenum cofactor biosynthesis enzyme MoaA